MRATHRAVSAALIVAVLAGLCAMIAMPGCAARDDVTIQPAAAADPTVYITKTGECYHRSSCSSLSKSKIAITKSEAIKKGYRACKRCRP